MMRYRASKLDCDGCSLKPRAVRIPARKILRSTTRVLATWRAISALWRSDGSQKQQRGLGATQNPTERALFRRWCDHF